MTVLEMRGIHKAFPGVVALDDVDFELRSGEVHVLVGENGAGKSTLMKVLSGAYRKDAGEILIDGVEVELRGPRHAQDLGISTIYQELNLIPRLSAAENIYLGREPHRLGVIDDRRMRRDARRLLDGLGLDVDPRVPVGRLGLAAQQMVEVAKALSLECRILVMDEPTAALTSSEVARLFAVIERLTKKGVAVVYISHRMEEVFRIGHRVTVLRDGRRVVSTDIASATVGELVRLMANRAVSEQFPARRALKGPEVLRVEGLTRAGALDRVSFTLHRGEVLGVAGLLGAGRTELARAIVGADRSDAGTVLVKGELLARPSPAAAIRRGVGFLPEDRKSHGLVQARSVTHNVSLPHSRRLSRLGVVNGRAEAAMAARVVNDIRIKTPGLDQKVMYLSGGNQQKVVLGKWIAGDADVLIFDEPTRGVDVGAKMEIYELINRLVARGAGVLMISSELPEVIGMSDRILVMRKGRVCAELDAAGATEEQVLNAALGLAS